MCALCCLRRAGCPCPTIATRLAAGNLLLTPPRRPAPPSPQANEPLGPALLTLHNIAYMARMMEGIRQRILNDEI